MYSQETNVLKISLTEIEDKSIKEKLDCVQTTMEKDLINMKL
jgi:hypothetical protein